MSKSTEITYSRQKTDFIEGRLYSNPRFYSAPKSGVTKVLLVGDWPQIEADYKALGIPVEHVEEATVTAAPDATPLVRPVDIFPTLTADDRAKVEIPDDWREMHGQSIRSLGTKLADYPILNKDQAIPVIEAELERRAKAEAVVTGAEDAPVEAMAGEA